ncbi:glycosyltransferase family 2 protein [Actinomycetospora termitidis]|uniref:Glycosyltransferase family 2 protein n=1 Tax=Actinomycetospora termitidis TaxID=3053470 RepID=A0ABT7MK70_9PSEU|nr:glycosyltransferase family 2 protein [Actinomycetospora sp. Odt1-22]MDL5160322.1 glycosyltransferase family 2 protein [Actinomycetospora sp. Odt1-22]
MSGRVDVVLPCLDEVEALPAVLDALPEGFDAVVADNGSTDGTPELAERRGALVVHEARKGYGAAVHAGLEASRTEVVATIDADGSLDPAELPAMVRMLLDTDADLVVGRRVPASRGVWPWHARMSNLVLSGLMRVQGVGVRDIAPVRVARRQALLDLGITDRAFGYPLELLIRAGAAGWTIREVDVAYRPRGGGRSKVSGSVRGTARAVRDMTKALARTRAHGASIRVNR